MSPSPLPAGTDSDADPEVVRFEQLPPKRRRRLMARSLLRSSGIAVLLMVAYFLLPFDRLGAIDDLLVFTLGMALVVVVVGLEARATLRSPYPRLAAIEGLMTSGTLFLVVAAVAHYLDNMLYPGSYSEPMTRLDALYFTLTTFATVGFGDITPISQTARVLTMLQMLGGLVLVGIIAKLLLGVAQAGVRLRDHPDRGFTLADEGSGESDPGERAPGESKSAAHPRRAVDPGDPLLPG